MTMDWFSTSSNPRHSATRHVAGRTGWKLHIVRDYVKIATPNGTVTRGTALCGLNATYGWSLDMFVEDRCKRCVAKMSVQIRDSYRPGFTE